VKNIQERLCRFEEHVKANSVKIMIIGLGSVGTYLLDYLVSSNDPAISVVIVGRNKEKMEKNLNIVRVAALIREKNKTNVDIEANVDLNDVETIAEAIRKHEPDIIVNSSRAYPGLKYGSISWNNVRAYGIWTPLSIRFTKNIMEACEDANSEALVINTSYSDAVIPWLKSAGKAYPDFGSGNLNHLIPRIRFAAADYLGVKDFWDIDVVLAAGHFHDVCISKEGQAEGVNLPMIIRYKGEEKDIPSEEVFSRCKIIMPTDAQRNMMNASSNYGIINALVKAVRTGENQRVHSPGALGNFGGYPVIIGYKDGGLNAWIDETDFDFEKMVTANSASMYLDGVEKIDEGELHYTNELLAKCKKAFGVELPKKVAFSEIERTAQFIIDNIITPFTTVS